MGKIECCASGHDSSAHTGFRSPGVIKSIDLKRFLNIEINSMGSLASAIINTDVGSVFHIHFNSQAEPICRSQ